ncbi:hypothetical protein DAPPUDRAFT_94321 [Daphnia pulex]|uniref:Ion transport domain-containing protein n=1 Tax=Daphnia pulex TaxID=6669 RepID=E9FR19_DAPPU|nr:hypothetical protein DAPPUDRAFT_94321 [Daphnia pulex]|eukprot:EFX90080.1 hypothetical protein DAPPUDRAFT_94321 [Daphnia pulex]
MSNRKSTKKDTSGLEESGAFSNDAFVKDEGPPVGNSEREIEKYRRSTIKKTISANRFFNKPIEDENEDDGVHPEDQSRHLSMDKKKRKAYHRQHCAKRKFRDSQNHNGAPTKKKQSSKKRMPRDEYGHRLERAFSISSESNTSHTELQGIDHHENFSSMPWYSSCSIWLQQMLAAAVEDLINTKEAFVIRMCKSFLDDSADQPDWDTLPSDCHSIGVLTSKAQINTKDALGRTPLHLAALSQSVDSVKELLENGAEIDNCDEMKETPLHGAVVKCRQSTDVVKLLISKGANVNAKDQFGQTPLHIAAFNENSKLAILLIHSGADLSIKNRAKISALASVVRRVPDALTAISRKLDSAVDVVDNEPADPDCQLKLDLRVLVPGGNQQNVGEMGFLTSLVAAEQRHILQHPVIGAFLHLKWMKIRTTFVVSLIFQLLYVLALTSNIYSIYVVKMNKRVNNTQKSEPSNATMTQFADWPMELDTTLWYLTVLLGAATGVKEFFQLYCNVHEYARDIENYFQLISILGMILILSPHPMHTDEPDKGDWQHHVAAIVIIVAWINLMLHVGRFPVFGLYVQMFTTVAWNIGKLLVAYMSLILGFSLGFAVLFPLENRYNDMPYALLTTIVMMTGEMEYAAMYTEGKIKYPGTTHFVFLVFLLFVVIVLMNLLVGLAVSDIQGLQKSAGLDRLVRLTKQIARMESFVFFPWPIHFSSLWSKVPRREFIRRNVLVVSPKTRKNYNFRPNDPRDRSFPPEIKESLLKIIAVRIANKKKGAQQKTSHVPIIRTATIPLDSNNGELFTEVMNRVDELFHNYMTQIVTINSTIEDQLAQLTAKYNYPSTRSRQTRHSCDCSMINEESFRVPGISSQA